MPLLKFTTAQLNLSAVLLNGQSFRWILHGENYYGTAHNRLWKICRKNEEEIEYSVLAGLERKEQEDDKVIRNYLQSDVDLTTLYREWSDADPHIKQLLEKNEQLKGIRILEQDPLETFFAFICSANNNIKRISKMVNRICTLYGPALTLFGELNEIETILLDEHCYLLYAFPTVVQLAGSTSSMEAQLRKQGFGYRAAYITKSVQSLSELPEDYLLSLRYGMWSTVKEELRKFAGVGPKVADCICLMGLGKHEVVPIDTHVFKATVRDYRKDLADKALTATLHEEIGNFYVKKFGAYAGWAQAVLFNAQLAQKRTAENDNSEKEKKRKKKK